MKEKWPLLGKTMNPLKRKPVKNPLDVGIKVINSLLTIGRGQRVGIVAGSGVGKSILLKMMSKFTDADVVVVGLIGERAREVGVMSLSRRQLASAGCRRSQGLRVGKPKRRSAV